MDSKAHLHYDEETLLKATDSERAFFETLARKLNENWFVFHSIRFVDEDSKGRRHEREIDVLLFNPLYGFLAVEVKGKNIKCDNGKYSIDGSACAPFAQALNNMYGLSRVLKQKLHGGIPFRMAFAVAFPLTNASAFDMPLRDKEALMDSTTMRNPEPWMRKRIREKASIRAAENPTCSINDILHILAPTSAADEDLQAIIDFASDQIERHSVDPAQFLSLFSAFSRLTVRGCAGSGKTLIATQKARQEGELGRRTLVLCYNTLLAKVIARNFKDGSLPVTVKAFYDFGAETLGLPPDRVAIHKDDPRTYAFISRELREYLAAGNVRPYDAVIIDEGQDFTDDMWEAVKMLVADDSSFYVFYDPEQNVFHTPMHLPDFGMPPVTLSVNCRNTRRITAELAKYSAYPMESKSGMPDGRPVTVIGGDCRANLEALLDKLVNKQKVRPESITILGAHRIGNTSISKDRTFAGVKVADGAAPKSVAYYTYMKFKGCDNRVVILLDVSDGDPRWDAAGMYTALSRATSLAFVLKEA